jgi:hypothetical protein
MSEGSSGSWTSIGATTGAVAGAAMCYRTLRTADATSISDRAFRLRHNEKVQHINTVTRNVAVGGAVMGFLLNEDKVGGVVEGATTGLGISSAYFVAKFLVNKVFFGKQDVRTEAM